MVDFTFRQLMMQAGMDSIADAGFHCNVCIVEDGASLLIYVLYAAEKKQYARPLWKQRGLRLSKNLPGYKYRGEG